MKIKLQIAILLFILLPGVIVAEETSPILSADWLYQADNKPAIERVRQEIGWARELAERIAKKKDSPDLSADLAELSRLEARIDPAEDAQKLYLDVRRVKRGIMFKNPVINFDKILLIDNPKPQGSEADHEALHRNGHMAVNGGRLVVLEGLDPDSPVRELVPEAQAGSFWRPDLSFDGSKVIFCMKPPAERSFHLYEVNSDGTNLRQLTFGDYDDLDPIYLPDGKIMFVSSRCNTYIRCGPFIYSYVLARCDADGKNIYLISRNSETDYLPTLMNDGKVIYSRWEYTDKALWRVQSLWQCNPDGRGVFTFWGNQSVWPDHVAEPRAIPGSRKIMFTGLGHHAWFAGSIGMLDPDKGLNFPDGLSKITQETAWPETGNGPVDPVATDNYHTSGQFHAYKTPYPLSEEDFLVSAQPHGGVFQLYLMDIYGNRELIFKGRHNAWHAIPFKAREQPPALPDLVEWPGTGSDHKPSKPGVLYSANIFEGAPEIPEELVKYLRVVEMDHKTYSTWQKTVQHDGPAVGIFQAETIKRFLGTTPVEKDGSVCFELPAGKAVFFQLLDKDYRCIQTMRSFTGVMPGEARGCLGCHEMRNRTPSQNAVSGGLAMKKGAVKLTPPPWGSQSIGYLDFVQPTLDKYCGECHQGDKNLKAKQKLDLTLRDSNIPWRSDMQHRPGELSPFKEPYITLVGGALGWGGSRPKDENGVPVMPLSGSYIVEGYGTLDPAALATLPPMVAFTWKSRLYENATSGKHNKVKIDEMSRRKLVAWIDANGPYLSKEDIRRMYDPQGYGVEQCQVRPRVRTAPEIDRFNIRQDGDSFAVAGPLVLAEQAPPLDINIIKAIYGTDDRKIDVTEKVRLLAKENSAGKLPLTDYNMVFSDPHSGVVKQLIVTYEVDGVRKDVTIQENTPAVLR